MSKTKQLKNSINWKYIIIGLILVIIIITSTVIIKNIKNKPNNDNAEQIINKYLSIITEADGKGFINIIDTQGYIIFDEKQEEEFDKTYNNKTDFINVHLKDKNYENIEELEMEILGKFENDNGYYRHKLLEITSVENSKISKKLVIVRAKVKIESDYYDSDVDIKFYLLKLGTEYKIVGVEK